VAPAAACAARSRRPLWGLVLLAAVVALLALAGALFTAQAVAHRSLDARVDATATAFSRAEQAGARESAPRSWRAASAAVNAAMAEVDRQRRRFVLLRSYGKAHTLLALAIAAADTARGDALAARAEQQRPAAAPSLPPTGTSAEARRAIGEVRVALDRAHQLLAALEQCRRKPRDFKKDLECMKGNLDGYTNQLRDLDGAYARGDYARATAQAETLLGQLRSFISDLERATTKMQC
jgi:hypothetical protein